MKGYMDLGDIGESKRIDMIGHRAVDHKEVVGFIVEKDGTKGDRCIKKLKDKFPQVSVMGRFDGPIKDVETIKVGVVQ